METTLDGIRRRIAATAPEDRSMRVMLVLAHEAASGRWTLADAAQGAAAQPVSTRPTVAGARLGVEDYLQLRTRVHEAVTRTVPAGSSVLVISKGDDELFVPGMVSSHFPQGEGGLYAGHYPADDAAAIAHFEHCRTGGVQFLLLPATAFWWIDHYPGFVRHLLARYRVARHDDDCLIFDLRASEKAAAS